jgi:hypothetical protein
VEIAALRAEGVARIGNLSEQAFLAAGTALYAGEGTKRDGTVSFANSDPKLVAFSAPGSDSFLTSTNLG